MVGKVGEFIDYSKRLSLFCQKNENIAEYA